MKHTFLLLLPFFCSYIAVAQAETDTLSVDSPSLLIEEETAKTEQTYIIEDGLPLPTKSQSSGIWLIRHLAMPLIPSKIL